MEEDWEFGLLFIIAILLLPLGEYVSILAMVIAFILIRYLKK